MSASFPNSLKSFTTKVDNVDDVLAAHINDLQLEVAAIETEAGANSSNLYGKKVGSGTFTNAASFSPAPTAGWVAGARYRLVAHYVQNTADGLLSIKCNADGGANYNYSGLGNGTGWSVAGATSILAYYSTWYTKTGEPWYGIFDFWSSGNTVFFSGQNAVNLTANTPFVCPLAAQYKGSGALSGLTFTPSAGSVTGAWTLYQLN